MALSKRTIRPGAQVLIGAGVALTILLGSFAFDKWRQRESEIARTEDAVRNTAELLAQHTSRTFDGVDSALREVARLRVEAEAGDYPPETIQRMLSAVHGGTPVIKSLGWLDETGERIITSITASPPPLNLGSTETFKDVRDSLRIGSGSTITPPFHSKMFSTKVFGAAVRLTDARGQFTGVAYGVINPAYFTQVFRAAGLGMDAVVTLFRRDGMILARQPRGEGLMGTTMADRPFITKIVPSAPSGTFQALGLSDGAERIIGFASTADDRFVLTVSVRIVDATAEFREEFLVGLQRLMLAAALLAVAAYALVRQMGRSDRVAGQLRESETKLRNFAEASGDWFWETDAEHRFVWMSGAVERASGTPAEWHLGRHRSEFCAFELMSPEAIQEHEKALEQRLTFSDFEYPRISPKGVRWIRTSGVPIFDHNDCFSGYRGSARDITELVATKERLRQAADAIPGAFLLFNDKGILVYKNAESQHPESTYLIDTIGETFETTLRRMIDRGAIEEAREDPEGWFRWRLERHRAAAGAMLIHHGDRIVEVIERSTTEGGTMVLRFDVTDRERANEEIRRARDEADAANRAKSEFLASMSHELRTPLNAIIGFGQLLKMPTGSALREKQISDYSDYIVTSGELLLKLVNDVLNLASIEAGNIGIDLEDVGAVDLIHGAIQCTRPLADRRNIRIDSVIGAGTEDTLLHADPQRTTQILLNLIANAIKYNRPDGSVSISTRLDGSELVIEVTDTGPGIAPDSEHLLFSSFQRLGAETGPVEGTGIGLAICKRLVTAMGGQIGYRPAGPSGSTFWISLPVATHADDEATVTDTPAPASSCPAPGDFSLLYVEDNRLNTEIVKHMVASLEGVTFLSAATGQAGLDVARVRQPDIILLDLSLPEMDGYAVLRHLQQTPETAAIPVIALTASAMPEEVARGLRAGFFRYLTKPVDFDKLVAALRAALAPDRVAGGEDSPHPDFSAANSNGEPSRELDLDRFEEIRRLLPAEKFSRLVCMLCSEIDHRTSPTGGIIGNGNLAEVASHLHALKGQCLNLGTAKLGHVINRMQELARAGNAIELSAAMPDFKQAGDETVASIARAMDWDDDGRVAGRKVGSARS